MSWGVPVLAGVAVLTAVAPPAWGLDPARVPSQYVTARWDTGAGLPSHSLYAIHQSRDGYLWLGTSAGLVRFDGARFVLVGAPGTPGFGDGGVAALAEGPDGTLYFSNTSGGAGRYAGGVFTPLPFPPGGEPAPIPTLLMASDGTLWMPGRSRLIYRHARGETHAMRAILPDVRSAAALIEDGPVVWIGTADRGLIAYGNERVLERHPITTEPIQALARDAAGALWLGTPSGLGRFESGRVRWYRQRDGLTHENISALRVDRDGSLWIGTAGGGLFRLRDDRIARLRVRDGLSDEDIRAIAEDNEGNLWVGTARGLTRVSDGRFVTHRVGADGEAGDLDPSVSAVAAARGGGAWAAMKAAGVARMNGAAESFPLREKLSGSIVAMHETADGRLWVSDGPRLHVLEKGKWRDQTPEGGNKNWKVSVIGEDSQGPLFFISDLGLARLEGRRAVAVEPDAAQVGYGHVIHRDANATLWIAGSAGLMRIDSKGRRLFAAKDGLPAARVRAIASDGRQGLWLATSGGLAHLEEDRVRTVSVQQGLPENYLLAVVDDGRGFLWVASRGHLFRLDKNDVREVMADRRERVSPVSFDASDGLVTTEVPLTNNAAFRASDGRIWFATAKGAAVVDPARVSTDAPAPPVLIETLTVDGRSERQAAYPPGRGDVAIDYAALAYGAPHKIRFRYRLHGQDPHWIDAGTRRSAYYSNLAHGDYRFEVMASNRDGVWNATPTALAFTLKPPFYRTTPFRLAVALAVAGLLLLAYRLRMRVVRGRFLAILDERTRIARELHDTLAQGLAGLGMQLDTALKILPEQPGLRAVRRELEQGRSLVRMSLSEVRRSIWVLRAHTTRGGGDLASSLSRSLAQLVAGSGADWRFEVNGPPRPLSPDLERSLLRIAHEAVINAVRHSGAKAIGAELRYGDEQLILTVRDDGAGFDPDQARSHADGGHFGLLGLSERARSLGGALRLSSRPGAGTEIECRLPYAAPGEQR